MLESIRSVGEGLAIFAIKLSLTFITELVYFEENPLIFSFAIIGFGIVWNFYIALKSPYRFQLMNQI